MEQGGKRIRDNIKVNPVVSVITIVHNGEKFIERAISSILSQSYDRFEYIIIDGNSSDRTLEIIKKYENNIDFWISEPDKGISDAFNKGFSYSRGEFIAYLNCDDWYESDILKVVAEDLKSDTTIYCGHMNLFSQFGNKKVKMHHSRPDRIFQTMRIAHPATFVPRKVFNLIGGFSSEYKVAMDYDFFLRARLKDFNFKVLEYTIANQLMGGNSSDLKAAFREELKIKNKYLPDKICHLSWFILNVLFHKSYLSVKSKFE
jgi:glycosyltransferase involved in cell wall biosynthesis